MSKQFHSPCLLQVEVLTVEIEHVDVDALETAAAQFSLDVEPTPHTLRLIQVTQMIKPIGCPSHTALISCLSHCQSMEKVAAVLCMRCCRISLSRSSTSGRLRCPLGTSLKFQMHSRHSMQDRSLDTLSCSSRAALPTMVKAMLLCNLLRV